MPDTTDVPNIILIYADDLGFGDVGCYGATEIPTPNIDRLAAGGLRFTEGHAPAATCTPSRYSLLTGTYPWRNEDAHILAGDDPLVISEDCLTIPAMLRKAGYSTGVVGKWHLGMGRGDIDWNQEISATPLDVGFDYSYVMAATNDRVPCVYVDNRRVVGLEEDDPIKVRYCRENPFPEVPTGRDNPEMLRMDYSHGHDMTIVNGISRIGYMRGGESALWTDEEMAEIFANKAVEYVEEHQDEPFFLYYALHQPHVPRVPGPRFAGSTGLGPRGDVIAEADWCVGEILNSLDRLDLAKDTLIIFTSDNGPVLDDGYEDQAVELCGDHAPAGPLRGGKYSMYDGGNRVPFIARWPESIEPGETDDIVSQVDLLASLASLTDQSLPEDAGPDSCNVLPALLGQSGSGRQELATEGLHGKTVLRQGDWVYIPPHAGPALNENTGIELGNSPEPQLYNLAQDIAQTRNLAGEHPERASQMADRLDEILESDRTRT